MTQYNCLYCYQCNAIIEEEDMTKYLTITDVDEKLRQHELQQHSPPPPPPEFTTLKKSDILNEAIKVNSCQDWITQPWTARTRLFLPFTVHK